MNKVGTFQKLRIPTTVEKSVCVAGRCGFRQFSDGRFFHCSLTSEFLERPYFVYATRPHLAKYLGTLALFSKAWHFLQNRKILYLPQIRRFAQFGMKKWALPAKTRKIAARKRAKSMQ
jgi:hypothetical protein